MKNRYRSFSDYLTEKFNTKVHKVSVDAGFSCPNIDGKISSHGCIYCDNTAFSFHSRSKTLPSLTDQIRFGIEAASRRFHAKKFIVYFQAHTNTHAPLDILKKSYDTIRSFKDIIGLSIATRPDAISSDILELIASYKNDYDVWVEYGLQSIHDKTLAAINRGHTYRDFINALDMTKALGIKVCAHIIIGLPGETRDMMLETAKEMARINIDGIKLHPLHIVKGTRLKEIYEKGRYVPLGLDEYARLASEFLLYLWPETIIGRLSAFCPKEYLIAPQWVGRKNSAERQIEKILDDNDYFQGKFYKNRAEVAV